MRSILNIAVGLMVFCFMGCDAPSYEPRASGSLAISADGKSLLAADSDNGLLVVVDAVTLEKRAEVKVGAQPFRIAVGKDGTVFVANRGSRSVSVINTNDWTVSAELPTGVDPVGMQLSRDGKTLYVVSSTALDNTLFGTLTAFDTATRSQKWELPVGEEPRGLGLLSEDRAVISEYKGGRLIEVDLANVKIATPNVEFYSQLNASSLTQQQPNQRFGPATFATRGMTDIAVSPDGMRAYATSLLARETPILTPPTPSTPYYKGQGPRLIGSVATSAVITLDRAEGPLTPQVDDVSGFTRNDFRAYGSGVVGTEKTDFPSTTFASNGLDSPVLQGPSVAVTDGTGDWLYVVNKESSNVAVISTSRREAVRARVSVDPGVDGIVILGNNTHVFVYSQYQHRVQRLTVADGVLKVTATSVAIATDTLPQDQVLGRIMFHDANNRLISAAEASVACSSCHLEGRDDGHTWQFPDGPRQTPTLAGRGILATAPFHWSGEFTEMKSFLTHTITARMGGKGLTTAASAQLNAFVDAIPAPENPYLELALNPAATRGAAIFERAQCGTCHAGEWLTTNRMEQVGSLVMTGINPDNGPVVSQGLNVPSLKGLARSAPYLHDGSALTIEERLVRNPNDQHGITSTLTDGERSDLAAYLKTL